MLHNKTYRECEVCKQAIRYNSHRGRKWNEKRRTCSRKCGVRLAIMENRWHLPNPANSWGATNTNWKGGIKWVGGYKMIKVPPETEGATSRGYMMEHRLVVQQNLGRPLLKKETIHHRNGIKNDNRLENLEIVTLAFPNGAVICPYCQKKFLVH